MDAEVKQAWIANALREGRFPIIQLSPEADKFACCLITVTELKKFGIQGYAQVPGGGQAYIRANWDEFELTHGFAEWVAQ